MESVSWWKMLYTEFGDDVKNIYRCTISEDELKREFDGGYGGTEGEPFFAWSENYVYFPVCYDGAEWVDRVPRNPSNEKPKHFGGG